MPAYIVLHKGNTLSLYAVRNDCRRHALGLSCFLKSSAECIKIMCIYVDYMEVKCFKFLINGIRRADICYWSVDLQTVIVHNDYQVVQLSVSRKHGSLPYLSLLDLAVA